MNNNQVTVHQINGDKVRTFDLSIPLDEWTNEDFVEMIAKEEHVPISSVVLVKKIKSIEEIAGYDVYFYD